MRFLSLLSNSARSPYLMPSLAWFVCACSFDPTGVTLVGEWSSSGPFITTCEASHLSFTQSGDSVFGTVTGLAYGISGTYQVTGTQHGADLTFQPVDQDPPPNSGCSFFSAVSPVMGRLTAADRFVLDIQGVDFVQHLTYHRL
jgi:hypothetical protein